MRETESTYDGFSVLMFFSGEMETEKAITSCLFTLFQSLHIRLKPSITEMWSTWLEGFGMKFGMTCPKLDEVCVLFVSNGAAGLRNSPKASFGTENCQQLLEAWQEGGQWGPHTHPFTPLLLRVNSWFPAHCSLFVHGQRSRPRGEQRCGLPCR